MIPYSMEYLKRKVVIYARVSTEHEAQISALENQLDWYKPLLDFHPEWTLVDRYVDEGITGTSAEKRPEFMRMMEDAKKHKFDLILTREVSRFARNTVDTLQYTRMLKEHGVEVYFINDGIKTFDGDGELRLTIMATLAQDESRKTSIRVKSGQQTSMNNGVYYGNGNILGYDRIEQILPDKTKLVDFVINPEQAKTVRLIFDMYLDGCGLVKIKDELERRGYKTAQGNDKWFPTVISHVLKNSFYCGIMTYHKEYTPDYLKQKKVKNYGELEFTQVQGTHEPIVTVEEFERVQRIMDSKKTEMPYLNRGRQKGKKPRTTVWGKLLICECGKTFNMRRWDRTDRQPGNAYQCYSSVATGSYESRKKKGLPLDGICQTPMIPEWRLQMMANLIFRKYLSEKDKVLALANSILESHIGDQEEAVNTQGLLDAKRRELEHLRKRMDAYIEMRAEGDLSREMFRSKCGELEPKILRLEEEIEKLSAESKPKEVVDYTEKLTVLQYALEQYTNRDEGQDVPESVIEAFVVKIVVSKDGFDWYLRFDGDPDKPLHCQLQGKRKQTTKIMVSGACSPAMDNSDTGCYQGWQELIRNLQGFIPAYHSVSRDLFVRGHASRGFLFKVTCAIMVAASGSGGSKPMTEMEKALAGLEFVKGDKALRKRREYAEALCFRLNNTHPMDTEKRNEILRELIRDAKEGCFIKSPFLCEYGDYISLGRNFFANYNCKLIDGGKITFGDDVLVGPDCTFVTAEHPTDPQRRLEGRMMFKPITVGNNVWFGAGVLVCPGVTIGDNCVIGAGSVVVRDIPANCVAVGNPCRVIRSVTDGDRQAW